MKATFVFSGLFLAASLGVLAQTNPKGLKPSTQEEPTPKPTMADLRTQYPYLNGLDDADASEVVQRVFYPDRSVEEVATQLGVKLPPPPPPPKKLGPIDRWRFESCQTDAAKAPTPLGVNTGLRICRERFGQ